MHVKQILIKELGHKVKVLELSKSEVTEELATLKWPMSGEEYKNWILNSFVPGLMNLGDYIKVSEDDSLIEKVKEVQEELYQTVIKTNPLLNPDQLYLTKNRKFTLTTGKNPISTLKSWSKDEVFKDIINADLHYFVGINAGSKSFTHDIETVCFKPLDINIKIRVFNEDDLLSIVKLLDEESSTHLKYSIMAVSIASFPEVINYVADHIDKYNLDTQKTLSSLFQICIKHNSFLYLNPEEVKYLKKESNLQSSGESIFEQILGAGFDSDEEEEAEIKTKSLLDIDVEKIQSLRGYLNDNLYGQEEAVESVCSAIELAYTGFKTPNSPIGAFLFYGPTSTGKTELGKLIAKHLVGSASEGLIKIPCATVLSEHHTIQTLIGAPPSYAGFEKKSLFSNNFTDKPNFKIVIFDEVDKAHPKVFDFLLELADEGSMMDSVGNVLDLSQTILIFTCNTGQKEAIRKSKAAGFKLSTSNTDHQKTIKEIYHKTVTKNLKPEFLARLDGEFFFKRLEEDDLMKSGYNYLNNFLNLWAEPYKVAIDINKNIMPKIIEDTKGLHGDDCHARHVNNYINKFVIKQLGSLFLNSKIKPKRLKVLGLDLYKGEINFNLVLKKSKQKTKSEISSI